MEATTTTTKSENVSYGYTYACCDHLTPAPKCLFLSNCTFKKPHKIGQQQ